MLSTDEDIQEIALRAARLKGRAALRRSLAIDLCASVACVVLLGVVLVSIPQLDLTSGGLAAGWYGSLVLTSPLMGYVLVGALSFLLGICVTLMFAHVRRLHDLDQGH